MFALRGLAVSFSVFVVVYSLMSVAISLTWNKVKELSEWQRASDLADVLFALRLLPFSAAVLVTVLFAIPSFLLLEPHNIVEPLGGFSLALGICGLAVASLGVANVLVALRSASRTISAWVGCAEPVLCPSPVPVLRAVKGAPPMTAVGIVRSRILLSGKAELLLNRSEFQSALKHEIAHVRRRDNLRKLLFRFVVFPFMNGLETAWLNATEMAADDSAVSNPAEALDLAAALIKLSRLGSIESSAMLNMSLVHSPVSLVNERVERLIHWTSQLQSAPRHPQYWVGAGSAFVVLALSYGHLLVAVHAATEWIVR